MKQLKTLLSFAFMANTGICAMAQGLVPDTLFGANSLFRPSAPFTRPAFTLVESNGKMITVGGNNSSMVVHKTKTCGFSDSTFGTNGRLTTVHLETSINITNGVLAPDGKILLCGTCRRPGNSWNQPYIIRLKANGTIDSGFGQTGRNIPVVQSNTSGHKGVSAVRILDDGKILCAGYAQDRFFSLRLKENGVTDSTFGTNGFVYLVPAIPNQSNYSDGIAAVLPDNRIFLQKYFYISGNDVTACRAILKADGTFDTAPGTEGFATSTDFKPVYSLRGAGEKLMALEWFPTADSTVSYLRRWNADLTPDESFGPGGRKKIGSKGSAFWSDFRQAPDGSWYIFGDTASDINSRTAMLYRYLPDFTRDFSFGVQGRIRFRLVVGNVNSQLSSHFVFSPTGELMTASTSGIPSNSSSFALLFNAFTKTSNVPKISYNPPLLSSTGQGQFQWQLNGGNINGATSSTYEPTVSGLYRVRLTDIRSCRIFSAARNVTFTQNLPISENDISVYPCPASHELKIGLPEGNWAVSLTGTDGKEVFSGQREAPGLTSIPVDGFAPGIYLLKIENQNRVFSRKVLVE